MSPKSAKRFSDKLMFSKEGMSPESAKRFSDRLMLH